MDISAAEKSLLLDIYVVSVEHKTLDPMFRFILERTKLPELEQKLLLRRLALSGHLIGVRLTPEGKIYVESTFSSHSMVVEMRSFSEALLLDMIQLFEGRGVSEVQLDDLPLYHRLPSFFFDFQLEVLETRRQIKRSKNGGIQFGSELNTYFQN
jgi:hypothetical protein